MKIVSRVGSRIELVGCKLITISTLLVQRLEQLLAPGECKSVYSSVQSSRLTPSNMAPVISKPASDAPQKTEESGTSYANLLKAQNRQPDAFDRAVMTWQAVTNGISKASSSIAKLAKKAKNKRDGVPGESFPDPRLQGKGKRE